MATTKLERDFQAKLIKELKELFVDCIVTKLDASHIQGKCVVNFPMSSLYKECLVM